MFDGLGEILDQADRALSAARDVAQGPELDRVATAIARLRRRIDHPDDLAVVALVGGTGSGKSSLFNALLETEAAEVGGVRPTTSTPLASAPRERSREIEGYLDWLDDVELVQHVEPANVALIDLPDIDSVEAGHRLTVEEVLTHADAVVWVVDIEKYRDEALHGRYLAEMTDQEDRFVFVLNQIDRLPETEWRIVTVDFNGALHEDGFRDPLLVPVAARPPAGPPLGIDLLRTHLEGFARGSPTKRAVDDLVNAVAAISSAVGGGSVEFEERWSEVLERVVSTAGDAGSIQAGRTAAKFFADLASELTGEPSRLAAELSATIGDSIRSMTSRGVDDLPEAIDAIIDSSLRPALRARGEAVAALGSLSLALQDWRIRHAR